MAQFCSITYNSTFLLIYFYFLHEVIFNCQVKNKSWTPVIELKYMNVDAQMSKDTFVIIIQKDTLDSVK